MKNFFPGKFFSDRKGQAFEGYNLMIGAIMALFMLTVIIGGITYVDEIRYRASNDRLNTAFANAVKSPNDATISAEHLVFKGGTSFTARQFEVMFDISEGCINFTQEPSSSIEVSEDGITLKSSLQLRADVSCKLNEANCKPKGIACELTLTPE